MSSPREISPHLDRSKVEEVFDIDGYDPQEADDDEQSVNVVRASDISEERMRDYLDEGYVPDDKFKDIHPAEEDIIHDLKTNANLLKDSLIAGVDGGRGRVERVQLQYLSAVGVGYVLPYTSPERKEDEKLKRVWGGAFFVIDDRLFDEEEFADEAEQSSGVTYNQVEKDKNLYCRL